MDNMTPVECYAMWNDELLKHILNGKGESIDADVVRYEMDKYWSMMMPDEQNAIRRLNES